MHDSFRGFSRPGGLRGMGWAAGIVAATLFILAAAPAPAVPPAGQDAVAELAWLAGSWSGETGGLAMEEHWTAPSGGALLGMHRDVKSGAWCRSSSCVSTLRAAQ
jgi:hypothetical protein